MKTTENYGLKMPEGTDIVNIDELSGNMIPIDQKLKELERHGTRHHTGGADALAPADIGAADAGHKHTTGDITTGTLPVTRGGTGQTSLQATRNVMGLGNTTGPLPVANGGTGATTAAAALSALGGATAGHVHSTASESVNGFLSAGDKKKLDGVAPGANAYTLPAAGASLGGVKTGGDVSITGGVITVQDDSHNHVIGNVDGLQTALDGKADVSHNHSAANITSGTLPIARGGTAATTAAAALNTLGAAAKSVAVSATLTVAGWTGTEAPYSQTVTVAGVTANNNIEVGLAANVTADQFAAACDVQLWCVAQAANSITVKAFGEKPTTAIPMSVLVLG